MGWWIDVESDDVLQFVDEGNIVGELELANAMRRQTMSPPDFLHGADRHAHDLGHVANRPMGGLRRRFVEGFLDHLGDDRV